MEHMFKYHIQVVVVVVTAAILGVCNVNIWQACRKTTKNAAVRID